jgi:ubiquinone/menaquinone biosynthesis C-methylase UbiE
MANLDEHWRTAIKKMKRTGKFSLKWYENHPITKELLKSDVLYGRVIEFGCGLGTRAYLVKKNVPAVRSVQGIDISSVAIGYAHRNWRDPHHRLWFYRWDLLLGLPSLYVDDFYDNGYMLATIEHIKDTDTLLSECQRVIKPGGKLFVSVTENNWHNDKSHVEIYDKRKLRQKLAAIGGIRSIYVKDHVIYATVEVE